MNLPVVGSVIVASVLDAPSAAGAAKQNSPTTTAIVFLIKRSLPGRFIHAYHISPQSARAVSVGVDSARVQLPAGSDRLEDSAEFEFGQRVEPTAAGPARTQSG